MKKGFTLIELIISLTILTLVMGSSFYLLGTVLKSWNKTSKQTENLQIAQLVLDKISRDIRNAKGIKSGSSASELILDYGTKTVSYLYQNSKVGRKETKVDYLTDVDDIKSLSFAYPKPKLVEINLDSWEVSILCRN